MYRLFKLVSDENISLLKTDLFTGEGTKNKWWKKGGEGEGVENEWLSFWELPMGSEGSSHP